MDWNAAIFIAAQFGTKFLYGFLVTAVKYEVLEREGAAQFAYAQVASQIARVPMHQLSGVLADTLPLKRLYVLSELFNLILISMLLFPAYGMSKMLFFMNIALGLAQAFNQPISKSLPPSVTSPQNLAIVNSWDLTGDKIGRNLAPMMLALLSSTIGSFRVAVFLSLMLSAALLPLKQILVVADQPSKQKAESEDKGSARTWSTNAVLQVWRGIVSLREDRTICFLICNTVITCMLIYPLAGVVFPVVFKSIPEGAMELEDSMPSRTILRFQDLLGIHAAKAWMNYASLVSFGGVLGPFLSSGVVYTINGLSGRCPEQVNWIGLNCGMTGQIVILSWLIVVLRSAEALNAGSCIFMLFFVWGAMESVNSITTIYFNAHTQQRLSRNERGKFIANILTLFTLAYAVGSHVYGWALASGSMEEQIPNATNILLVALVLRITLFVSFRRDKVGRQTVMLKTESSTV